MPTPSLAGVEVRDAGRSDLPGVRRLLLGAYQEYAPAMPPAVFGRYLTDLLDLEGRAESGRLLVAVHGGQVVGTVTFYADAAAEGLTWPAGWAGLRALGVAPSARGLGIGRALVSECRRRAQAAGAPVLCLHTAGFMAAALALYERMGFRRDPTFDFDAAGLHGLEGVQPVPILAYRIDLPHRHVKEHTMDTPAAQVGELYENPVTGERGIVRIPPGESNGHLLVVDLYLRPGGRVAGEHVHPATTEAFTVVGGRLAVRHDGRELQADPGTRVQVPPGVAHDFWNASDEEVRVLVEVQPGERLAQLIRQLFLAAQDGRTDARGRPRPLHAAVLAQEFADVMRFTRPPQLVQRALSGLLAPVARATGHRGLDPHLPPARAARGRPRPAARRDRRARPRPRPPLDQEHDMNYEQVRDLLVTQWTYTAGPNEEKAAQFYHDDALLEFPQSGERFRGRANITAWRRQYPTRLDFEPRELRGGGDFWVWRPGCATTAATRSAS